MRLIRCTQQSDLWIAARVGRITGSRLGDLMAAPTSRSSRRKGVSMPAGSEAACRAAYRQELVVERIYRRAKDHYVSRAMQEGAEREPFARMLYEADTMQQVEQVGFALHPEWDWFGCSADGLCGTDGGVELKSPTEGVHDSYVANPQLLADEYQWQVLGCLVCFPEREWWDLVSFQPYAPDEIKLVKFRFHRADWKETIAKIEFTALSENDAIEAEIRRRGLPPTVFEIMPDETHGLANGRSVNQQFRDAVAYDDGYLTDSDITWAKAQQGIA